MGHTVLVRDEPIHLRVSRSERTLSDTAGPVVLRILVLTNTVPMDTRPTKRVKRAKSVVTDLRVVRQRVGHLDFDGVAPVADDSGSRELAVDGEHLTRYALRRKRRIPDHEIVLEVVSQSHARYAVRLEHTRQVSPVLGPEV